MISPAFLMTGVLLVPAQSSAGAGCPGGELCVEAHQLRDLPDYRLRCSLRGKPAFDLAIAGSSVPHRRPATITPVTLHLPAGPAGNDYAPVALNFGGSTDINESFKATEGDVTYYLVVSVHLDRRLDGISGVQDARVSSVRYEISRGTSALMAKRYAEGDCTMMDKQS